MREAVYSTLKALYETKEVTVNKQLEYGITRISNEILTLRNRFNIDITMDRINTKNKKWYGSYILVRTDENLKIVKEMLDKYSPKNNDKNGGN